MGVLSNKKSVAKFPGRDRRGRVRPSAPLPDMKVSCRPARVLVNRGSETPKFCHNRGSETPKFRETSGLIADLSPLLSPALTASLYAMLYDVVGMF